MASRREKKPIPQGDPAPVQTTGAGTTTLYTLEINTLLATTDMTDGKIYVDVFALGGTASGTVYVILVECKALIQRVAGTTTVESTNSVFSDGSGTLITLGGWVLACVASGNDIAIQITTPTGYTIDWIVDGYALFNVTAEV